jgi:antitoxin (DNA-binding transcriptional repressor) of toxin-antitoxin stability system
MVSVTVEDAQAHLPELIDKLQPGEAVLITRGEQPVAQLLPLPSGKPQPRFGSCKDKLTIVAEDEDHLKDFREYMP